MGSGFRPPPSGSKDKISRMCRLVWIFTERICQIIPYAVADPRFLERGFIYGSLSKNGGICVLTDLSHSRPPLCCQWHLMTACATRIKDLVRFWTMLFENYSWRDCTFSEFDRVPTWGWFVSITVNCYRSKYLVVCYLMG